MLRNELKSVSRRNFLIIGIYAGVACFVLSNVDPFVRLASAGDEAAPMNKVPGLDYVFDGGVYTKETLPKPRFHKINRTFLSSKDKDLHFLFEVPELYEAIGKHIEPKYKSNEIVLVGFGKKGVNEVGIIIKNNDTPYLGFIPINESIRSLLEKYDKA